MIRIASNFLGLSLMASTIGSAVCGVITAVGLSSGAYCLANIGGVPMSALGVVGMGSLNGVASDS